jgi:hypothetical protein
MMARYALLCARYSLTGDDVAAPVQFGSAKHVGGVA